MNVQSITPLLKLDQVVAGYGNLTALHGVSLHVNPGEVVALLGANGAGKTTTILGLAGVLPALAGEVLWRGAPTTDSLARRARRGLALVPEERSVVMGLSVAENLRLGRGGVAPAVELFPELRDHLSRPAGLLSGGQQQMLSLARALAARPAVLLADELSLGLAPLIVERLLREVRRVADADGVGVLLVEQHVRLALQVADRAYVLRRGRCVLSGPAAELDRNSAEIERMYLAGAASP